MAADAQAHLVRLTGRSVGDDRYVCSRCGYEMNQGRDSGVHLCHGCGSFVDTDDEREESVERTQALRNLDVARRAADRETSVVSYSGGYNGSLCDEHDVSSNRGSNVDFGLHRGQCTMCHDEYKTLLRAQHHDHA